MVFHQSIVRLRAGVKQDRGGNTIPDWSEGAVSSLTVSSVSVQPSSQEETPDETRTAVTTGWRVISAPGVDADIRANDRILWDGKALEIVGEVARHQQFLDGSTHHIEFFVRRATG
ncbi:hypothetical protein [Streptomyces sp. NPDC059165]|uniref:hypothetical protein n=1 Tax=Streptomyces sp. NPDC059165 TaxID=3346751 RepID=UPI003686AF17